LANAMQAIATLLLMCDARDLGVAVGEDQVDRNREMTGQEQGQFGPRNQTDGDNAGDPKRAVLRSSFSIRLFAPNIYLYDKYPGGIGFSEPLFRMSDTLLADTLKLIGNCPCAQGCPSCVGPGGEVGEKGKEVALAILGNLSTAPGP